ncbi:MAG TPA: TPM domain-containing protein [Pedobacter sp.]|uniref:TPM domain-containing protein n=1 Tax=Pedobacter sp. TaxID=1411316 RepID=UPI002B527B2A|nr:TPM domain-containing protein [Pedobacter sp.]HMI04757.1 TPM domain-containing protein [Pedobacter sp.]
MKKSSLFLFVCIVLLMTGCDQKSQKERISGIPDPKKLNETYVSNPDQLLSPETVSGLNAKLSALDQAGTAHIDVVFVKTIGELVPKEVAHELFNTWKIGDKETNNGLLILIVQDQKRIEFETGYGLEGVLPDVICYRIQQQYMIPYAKLNDFNSAVKQGVDAVISHLTSSPAPNSPDTTGSQELTIVPPESLQSLTDTDLAYNSQEPGDVYSLILAVIYFVISIITGIALVKKASLRILIILFIFIAPVLFVVHLNLNYPVSWHNLRALMIAYIFLLIYTHIHIFLLNWISAPSFKAGNQHEQYLMRRNTFASMEWVVKVFAFPFLWLFWKKHQDRLESLRYENINCEHCGRIMILTNEAKDDEFLSKGQAKEEEILSVDYDVWVCKDCGLNKILDYSNLKSKARECTQCHFITALFSRRETIEPATTSSQGYGYDYFGCANCGKETHEQFIIPKISTSSSSSSSSGSSSGSSSSSSGGSSGGGGAGSSW